MATKLQLWNRALYHLGEGKLVDTDPDVDGTEPAYVFDEMWPTVALDALSRGDWDFAIKTAEISQSVTTTVIVGYNYAYDHPDDWVRTICYSLEPDFTDSVYAYDADVDVYHERGSYFTNADKFYLRYVSDDYVDDSEIAGYPPSYFEFCALLLAAQSCERLTQGTEQAQKLEKAAEKQLVKAKSNDARNLKQQRIRRGNWLRSFRGDADRRGAIGTLVGGEIEAPEGET